jgi:phosphomevalonate kinase
MTNTSYSVKVPGKLMIAGEYAVLEQKQQAVVAAINRYVTANIKKGSRNCLSLPQLGLYSITWENGEKAFEFSIKDSRLLYIRNAIAVVNQFLRENSISMVPIQLTIKSELDDPSGRKYGLGSSAAVVTAVVSSILQLYSDKTTYTLDQVFKLSCIAHFITQKGGSGADVAASVFGGWLAYSSFNPVWLLKQFRQGENLTNLTKGTWPELKIVPIKAPADLRLCVGWTKQVASTADMIKEVHAFRDHNPGEYASFLDDSAAAAADIIQAFATNDCDGSIAGLVKNRLALGALSEISGIEIETMKLRDLCVTADRYGGGKSSGAGGGDCGIAFVKGEDKAEMLFQAWREIGIQPLNLSLSNTGAIFTEYNCEPSLNEYFHLDHSKKNLEN